MIKLRTVLAGSAAILFANMANAQTMGATSDTGASSSMSAEMPMSSGASATADMSATTTTDQSRMQFYNDPFVQKRAADKAAKAEYKMRKHDAKREYKDEKAQAKADLREAKKEAREERKEAMSDPSSQQPAIYSPGK